MKKLIKKKKLKPRIPVEVLLKLRSYPITEKKPKKGYDRKSLKKKIIEDIEEDLYQP